MVAIGLLAAGLAFTPALLADDPPVTTVTVTSTVQARYQGKGIRWWVGRAVQNKKDANARGQTILSLRRQNDRLTHQDWPYRPATSIWDRVASCESGRNWDYNGRSGFDGGLQFHPGTWAAYRPAGYPSFAYQASREQQIVVAEMVLSEQGWGAWPACSRELGLR